MLSDSLVFYDKYNSFGLLLMISFGIVELSSSRFFDNIYGVMIETSIYYGYFFSFIFLTYLIYIFRNCYYE